MKIIVKREIVTFETIEVNLKDWVGIQLEQHTPLFKALIKEFLNEEEWETNGITCHKTFSDFPSISQGGTNTAKLVSMEILEVNNNYDKIAVEVTWETKNSHAIVIMEKVTGQ